ncbi:MAG TPA: hypothetical protein VMH28_02720 [Candidatus Acidoferrales bacterium]|nr:hypothetical protein [Candidatus Acidoferrales bacterium]
MREWAEEQCLRRGILPMVDPLDSPSHFPELANRFPEPSIRLYSVSDRTITTGFQFSKGFLIEC